VVTRQEVRRPPTRYDAGRQTTIVIHESLAHDGFEAYIEAMACSPPIRVAFLNCVCALLFGPVIRAQSQQQKHQTCSPSCVSTDEFKEMTGKRVYPKMIIDDVKFDGPVHLPDSTNERKVISDIKHRVFDYGQEGLDEILEVQIRGAWQDQGYFKVTATGQTQVVSSDSTCEHVMITIRVDPGRQYRLGDVRFRESDPGQPLAFTPEELRKLIPLQEGDIFNVTKIRESLDALKKLYSAYAYINFVSTPITDVDDAALRVSLMMELAEGKQFRVRTVEVFGLKPSKAAMLTSTVKPGDLFQDSVVEAFVKENLPGFLDVTRSEVLDLRKNEKEGTVDIVVDFRRLPKK
jgi:outer membrane protein assembly factor BamA